MVAVYLLGHKVGNIKEPIVYVNHDVFDYNGNIVVDGHEEPFVEILTHNSIIVQIPLLHGNVNNRLEKVLSVFDQTQVEGDTQQVLKIDEDKYADDNDMMYMLHKLTAAAANSEMRQDMNVEDEYCKASSCHNKASSCHSKANSCHSKANSCHRRMSSYAIWQRRCSQKV